MKCLINADGTRTIAPSEEITATDGYCVFDVKACGICGTDVHIFEGDEGAAPTPKGTVLGHEFAGEVVAVGDEVKRVKVGDKVITSKYAGTEVKADGVEYNIVRQSDILAIVE